MSLSLCFDELFGRPARAAGRPAITALLPHARADSVRVVPHRVATDPSPVITTLLPGANAGGARLAAHRAADRVDDAEMFDARSLANEADAVAVATQRKQLENIVIGSCDADAVDFIATATHPAVVRRAAMLDAVPLDTRAPFHMPAGEDDLAQTVLRSLLDAAGSIRSMRPDSVSIRPESVPFNSWMMHAHLLVQSGTRASPAAPMLTIDSPPCMYGNACVGMDPLFRIEGFPRSNFAGVVFMCVMDLAELRAHLKTGAVPARDGVGGLRRPCLLCMWRVVTRLEINSRCEDRFRLPAGICLNHHRVDVRAGEYLGEACIQPSVRNGLIWPMPAFDLSRLFARQDGGGTWYVDHSAMRWHASEPPAESGRSFR